MCYQSMLFQFSSVTDAVSQWPAQVLGALRQPQDLLPVLGTGAGSSPNLFEEDLVQDGRFMPFLYVAEGLLGQGGALVQ